ncbi:hypothetical protein EW145_g1386 [Phellinidium pouzarii]|uniref:Uncharacterized protein n=1 Tax=Phellinidium pouzarii TaxID=167371 RepID=A0A4V6S1A7_9AGAM|nr:hypothetical protein EW145_g1386 [Phellinidium pouzarii]
MSDLTFCHLHMTNRDMLVFETFESPSTYLSGELSDEELEIPAHEVPPNPDDSDILPSQVHPSYPYGNPTNLKHPAARPRKPTDHSSRALFADLTYAGGGVNGALRWCDLALDRLLPVDREKEEAARAALARKMASGTSQNNNPAAGQPHVQPAQPGQQLEESDDDVEEESEGIDSVEDDDDDENENSENFEASFDDD